MPTKKELSESSEQLAKGIREWCLSQVHLWQQIPNLAIEANGRTGFSDDLVICSDEGFWDISTISMLGGYILSVDCSSGRLVDRFAKREAQDDVVLWLSSRLDEIDASKVIGYLVEQANKPRPIYYSEEAWAEHEVARSARRKACGLGFGKPYRRREPIAA